MDDILIACGLGWGCRRACRTRQRFVTFADEYQLLDPMQFPDHRPAQEEVVVRAASTPGVRGSLFGQDDVSGRSRSAVDDMYFFGETRSVPIDLCVFTSQDVVVGSRDKHDVGAGQLRRRVTGGMGNRLIHRVAADAGQGDLDISTRIDLVSGQGDSESSPGKRADRVTREIYENGYFLNVESMGVFDIAQPKSDSRVNRDFASYPIFLFDRVEGRLDRAEDRF